jgi:glycosyltransferase involved in cell wall biosynthesis
VSRINWTFLVTATKIFLFKGGDNLKENAPKISVIVPMYNAENYLKLCVTSILEQTFKDFELILIDDCSTDKTLEVAESFTDSRIKILRNEKNLGMPGAVRNIGIDAAKGEYIYFCDADDAILPKCLETLYNAAEENNADLVNMTQWYRSKIADFQTMKNIPVTQMKTVAAAPVSSDLKTRITQEFLANKMHVTPWISFYRRKFLIDNKIKFPVDMSVAEDVVFIFLTVYSTSKIVKIDTPFYIYRMNPESISHTAEKIQRNIQCLMKMHEHIEEKLLTLNDFEFTQKILNYWTNHVIGSYIFPFVRDNKSEIVSEMSNALQTIFEKNSSFVLTLLQIYSQFRLTNAINRNIQAKLAAENKKLKTALENIQKQITEVTKA